MAKIKITIESESGEQIGGVREYFLELREEATLAEIEAAVEQFKRKALPEIEKEILEGSQAKAVKKKRRSRTKRNN
jgi:hypothetical protein